MPTFTLKTYGEKGRIFEGPRINLVLQNIQIDKIAHFPFKQVETYLSFPSKVEGGKGVERATVPIRFSNHTS
jgi:hypothetical protein